MHPIGHINMEGGPILIGDSHTLRHWRGVYGDDYNRLCRMYDEADPEQVIKKVKIGAGEDEAIAWEAGGEGTIDVFEMRNGLMLLRGWVNEDSDIKKLAREPIVEKAFSGELTIPSKRLAILWSPEDGAIIQQQDFSSQSLRPSGNPSIEDSCLLVNLKSDRYEIFCDQVSVGDVKAIRCWLMECGIVSV